MEWLKKNWYLITTAVAFVIALTTTDIQVKQNANDIKAIENRQSTSDLVLQDIRVELASINTKLEMIMKNSHLVVIGGEE